jgi:hypothetical protein
MLRVMAGMARGTAMGRNGNGIAMGRAEIVAHREEERMTGAPRRGRRDDMAGAPRRPTAMAAMVVVMAVVGFALW